MIKCRIARAHNSEVRDKREHLFLTTDEVHLELYLPHVRSSLLGWCVLRFTELYNSQNILGVSCDVESRDRIAAARY